MRRRAQGRDVKRQVEESQRATTSLRVRNVFRVSRSAEQEAFTRVIQSQRLLFHVCRPLVATAL